MKKLTLLFASFILLLSSCTKNYETVPANSKYLIGNGSNFYMPLAINNSWTYDAVWNTVITTRSTNNFIMNDNGVASDIWNDTAGAYMMKYNSAPLLSLGVRTSYGGAVPFVLIPATPVNGQTWTVTVTTGIIMTARVINTDAAIATNVCGYTGCLQISYTYDYTDMNGKPSSVSWIRYFKKGVGQVYATSNVNDDPGISYGLKEFILN